MKKIISFLLMTAMLFAMLPFSASAAWARDSAAVYSNGASSFCVTVDMPEYYIPGETLTTEVRIENIRVDDLSLVYFEFYFDSAKLRLLNNVNNDGSLDCIAQLPGDDWENFCVVGNTDSGMIIMSVLTAADAAFAVNDGDISFSLQFMVNGDANGTINCSVPDDRIDGYTWADPVSSLRASGSSASSACHEHAYALVKHDAEQHKYVCSCGKIVYEAHDFKINVTEPNCENGGYTVKTCKDCGEEITTDYIDASGHKPGSAATCTKDRTCTVCGKVIKAKLGHDYTAVVTKPTCEEKGYTTHTCSRCGDSYVDSYVDASGHKSGAEATCTKDQTCMVCGKVIKAKLGHDYTAVVTKPTCEEKGYTTHTCSRCGDSYVDSYVDASGHKPGSAATCTKDQTCAVCGKVIKEKLGHDYTAVVTKPTCEEKGYTTHTCSRCGDHYVDSYVDASGHTAGEWIIVKEPAIGVEGLKEKHCTVCGKTIESEVIPALKPEFVKGDVNGNGDVDAQDYALAKRYCLGTYTLTEEQIMRGDVTGDGDIDAKDYGIIKRHVLGTYTIR